MDDIELKIKGYSMNSLEKASWIAWGKKQVSDMEAYIQTWPHKGCSSFKIEDTKFDFSKRRTTSKGGISNFHGYYAPFIDIAMYSYVQPTNVYRFYEYKSYDENKVFGGFYSDNIEHRIIAVICHEMAHQIGYASESECNFIGFMACIKNDDLYFQYAAYSMALRYCLENVMLKNEVRFKALKTTINPGIIENYKESQRFWEQYDTFIDKGFHAFYNQFLKMNQQKDGLESYSKFVDLLINYYKGKELR
jgi:hypothetical protein